jgi:putative SOS response-associated peptidase YedK
MPVLLRRSEGAKPAAVVGDDDWITGEGVESGTILKIAPNSLLARVQDRMPVILRPDTYDLFFAYGPVVLD